MTKLSPKDVFMEDRDFSKDLKIKKATEEEELFELIMDSVCNEKGICMSKEIREKVSSKFRDECKLFREYMESSKVKPLRRRN